MEVTLICGADGKIHCLEAGKVFVDALLSLLLLPLARVVNLCKAPVIAGISNMATSIHQMDVKTLDVSLGVLLTPRHSPDFFDRNLLTEFFHKYPQECQFCKPSAPSGYVKDSVRFIVTDELEIFPSTTTTSVQLLQKFKVRDMNKVKTITVAVDKDDLVKLLNAALLPQANNVLNQVFGARAADHFHNSVIFT